LSSVIHWLPDNRIARFQSRRAALAPFPLATDPRVWIAMKIATLPDQNVAVGAQPCRSLLGTNVANLTQRIETAKADEKRRAK
ncbi:MAG: hypothetical protein ACOYNR_16035, partial [Blastocatellia bacterium]